MEWQAIPYTIHGTGIFIYHYLHFVVDFHGIHVGKYTVRPVGPMAWEWKWVPQILQGFRFLFFPLFGAPIFRIWDSVGSLQKIHARGSDWKSSKDRSLQEKVFEVLGFSKEEVQMDDLDDGRASPWGFLSAIFLGKNWCFFLSKREKQ